MNSDERLDEDTPSPSYPCPEGQGQTGGGEARGKLQSDTDKNCWSGMDDLASSFDG
jgi:hypothetical protein